MSEFGKPSSSTWQKNSVKIIGCCHCSGDDNLPGSALVPGFPHLAIKAHQEIWKQWSLVSLFVVYKLSTLRSASQQSGSDFALESVMRHIYLDVTTLPIDFKLLMLTTGLLCFDRGYGFESKVRKERGLFAAQQQINIGRLHTGLF